MTVMTTGLAFLAAAAASEPVTSDVLSVVNSDRLGCLTMTSAHSLSGGEGFGGYSGMVLDQEDGDLLLLADNGHLYRMAIALGDDGAVTSVSGGTALAIRDERGRALVKRNGDTEALTPWQNGYLMTREALDDALLIKDMGDHFVIAETVADLSGSEALSRNGGYEAATSLSDGQAIFISEGTFKTGEAAMILFDGESVLDRGRYQPAEDFAVTDIAADVAGDRLFAVERAFSPALGPRTRLTVSPLSNAIDDDTATLVPAELGRLTLEEGTDNMEGIAFYQSSDGGENLMIISDDNFNPIQRTVLMTFRLGDTCPL